MLDLNKLIGRNLRRLRLLRGLSQSELANKIGTSSQRLSSYETGRDGMGKDYMERVCKALHAHPWEFFVEDDTPILSDEEEKHALEQWRQMKAAGVAEEAARYGMFRMAEKKKKE